MGLSTCYDAFLVFRRSVRKKYCSFHVNVLSFLARRKKLLYACMHEPESLPTQLGPPRLARGSKDYSNLAEGKGAIEGKGKDLTRLLRQELDVCGGGWHVVRVGLWVYNIHSTIYKYIYSI